MIHELQKLRTTLNGFSTLKCENVKMGWSFFDTSRVFHNAKEPHVEGNTIACLEIFTHRCTPPKFSEKIFLEPALWDQGFSLAMGAGGAGGGGGDPPTHTADC